jgi:hypothetical protein
MFEDKKWSNDLKQLAREIYCRGHSTKEEVTLLIELAIKEGQQNVLDEPRKFELGNCEDCDERRHADEPPHNEGYD